MFGSISCIHEEIGVETRILCFSILESNALLLKTKFERYSYLDIFEIFFFTSIELSIIFFSVNANSAVECNFLINCFKLLHSIFSYLFCFVVCHWHNNYTCQRGFIMMIRSMLLLSDCIHVLCVEDKWNCSKHWNYFYEAGKLFYTPLICRWHVSIVEKGL